MTKYYTVTVEILVKASHEYDAFDIVESTIDDMVCNSKVLQDYTLTNTEELEVRA